MTLIDRRIRRTKKLLKEALVTLTLEKGYEDITIQDLTNRADIGYRTFFRHYADKDVLLQEVLANTLEEIRTLMTPPPPEFFLNPDLDVSEFTDNSVLFKHVQEHEDFYRVLMRSERSIMESVMAFSIKELKANFGELPPPKIPLGIVANHIVGATFAMVRWWLDNDMKHTPEEMGSFHTDLVLRPFRRMVLDSLNS